MVLAVQLHNILTKTTKTRFRNTVQVLSLLFGISSNNLIDWVFTKRVICCLELCRPRLIWYQKLNQECGSSALFNRAFYAKGDCSPGNRCITKILSVIYFVHPRSQRIALILVKYGTTYLQKCIPLLTKHSICQLIIAYGYRLRLDLPYSTKRIG